MMYFIYVLYDTRRFRIWLALEPLHSRSLTLLCWIYVWVWVWCGLGLLQLLYNWTSHKIHTVPGFRLRRTTTFCSCYLCLSCTALGYCICTVGMLCFHCRLLLWWWGEEKWQGLKLSLHLMHGYNSSPAQIAGTRAEPQQIVAQRLLSCLQYPVPFKSSTKDLTWPTWTLFWHMMLTRGLSLYTNIGQGEYHRFQHGFWLRGVQPLSCRW